MKSVVPIRTQKRKLIPNNRDEYDDELPTLSTVIIAVGIIVHRRFPPFVNNQVYGLKHMAVHSTLKNVILVRDTPIDGSMQKIVPTSLRAPLIQQAHYSTIEEYPGQQSL